MNTDLDAANEPQLWNSVCLATKKCHRCGGTGADNPVQPYGLEPNTCLCAADLEGPKPGRTWALPGMQGKCLACGGSGRDIADSHLYCPQCHGSGHVAKRDMGALLFHQPADMKLEVEAYDDGSGECRAYVATDGDFGDFINKPFIVEFMDYKGEQALLRAIAQALMAQGGELGAT